MPALALLVAAFASTAGAQAPDPEPPLLAARSDGTWVVTEAIHEEPPPSGSVIGGLAIDEERDEAGESAEAVAEAEAEAAAQRAFEEAVDAARREPNS